MKYILQCEINQSFVNGNMMGSRRERIEVILCGGRPWGFSIKGGQESNKPLVVSKLEKGGKAECGGLFVGDVVFSINNVQLSGMRSEAIQFVKQSGHRLVLEVERGIHQNTMKTSSYHTPTSRQSNFPNQQYYKTAGQSMTHDDTQHMRDRYNNPYDHGDTYERPSGREDDVFDMEPDNPTSGSAVASRGAYPTEGARDLGDFSSGERDFGVSLDYQPSRSTESASKEVGEPPVQPTVKLRERKTRARERGVQIERPRSWHASKYPDVDEETARSMRTPTTAYHNSPAAQRRHVHHQPMSTRRRSKGWGESGDLKSAYSGDINGSKDSLISGSSHRSNRMSVSSSRSSGTMSSSRGSIENLVDNNNGYPQIILNNRNKHHSPSKPHPGIVNQAKSMFENLSHDRGAALDSHYQFSRGSREDLERMSRVRRMPSDDADNPKSPLYQPSGRSSFSPPPAVTDVRNTNRGRRSGAYGSEENVNSQRDPKYKFSAARIVKTNLDERRPADPKVPDPPQRDSSSVQAVKNYHHTRPHSASSPEDRRIFSSSPDRHGMSPPHNTPSYRQDVTHQQKSAEKSAERQPKTQGRIFGLTSDGKLRQVKAFDQEQHSEVPVSRSPPQGSGTPPRYEHVKDSFSHYEPSSGGSDYLSRKMAEHQKTASYSDPVSGAAEHTRGGSEESVEGENSDTGRGRGKYGSLWKTPQVHRRSKSNDFANVVEAWSTHDPPPGGPKLSVFKPAADAEKSPPDGAATSRQRTPRPDSKEYDSTDNQTSILRHLQISQQASAVGNYEMMWSAQSAQKSPKNASPTDALEPKDKRRSGKDWSYSEVDQTSDNDDAFEPNDYSQNIKHMQKAVLRVTSFTRPDLASPSQQSFDQKRNIFNLSQTKAQPYVIHNRSRSHGNEIDEGSEPISGRSSHKSSNDSLAPSRETTKPRPKSAGVTRQRSSRHAPVQRNVVAPTHNPPPYYTRKAESLPRNVIPSFNSDDSDYQPSPSRRSRTSPVQKNRRISIDVKPDIETPKSDSKVDARRLMIDYMSQKASRSNMDSSPSLIRGQPYPSSTSIHTSHSDETEKRRREAKSSGLDGLVAKTGSSGDLRGEGRDECRSTPTSHHKHEHASVRKAQNFSAVRAKFQGLTKSKTIISEEPLKARSSSFDNLTDEKIEVQSPSHSFDETDDGSPIKKRDRSKSSPNVEPPSNISSPHDENVHAPPRRPRNRQRHSNSSSASSATTISNLSSLSSVSTTSIGKFPVLDEVNEQPGSPNLRSQSPAKQDDIVLTLSPLEDAIDPTTEVPPAVVEPEPAAVQRQTPKQRQAFNTNTYRVPKRDKKPKKRSSREGDGESGDETKHVSKVELRITSPTSVAKVTESPVKPPEVKPPLQDPPKHVTNERVTAIIEKVKRSASMRGRSPTSKTMAPPPTVEPGEGTKEQLVSRFLQRQQDLPLPPPPPPPPIPTKPPNERALSPTSQAKLRPSEEMKTSDLQVEKQAAITPPLIDSYKEKTYLLGDSDSEVTRSDNNNSSVKPGGYENVHVNGMNKSYENVFKPVKVGEDVEKETKEATVEEKVEVDKEVNEEKPEEEESKIVSSPPPEISPEPLLPDVSLLPASTLQQEHPDLTRDIMKVDKSLAQMLTTSNKQTMDYMTGVLPQPSYTILQEGMRYRLNKPTKAGDDSRPSQITTDISHENLPASSAYYKTSASKAKILNMVKEKMAGGELMPEEDQEEINRKKMELVLSIKDKLNDLHSMKDLLDVEMRENEVLGKQVFDLTKQVCSAREQEKYNIFVQDVDRIINLLLSLSARLARVENAIQMLPADADKQEMELLCEKRKRLTEQHVEAKTLKENIDRRQKAVSEILAGCLNHEQFADYEHYIKMKSALIMEQRELSDKSKLGEEQMQCLRDSLPEEWQAKLDKMLEE